MDEEEKARAQATIRQAVEAAGFETLRLSLSNSRNVILTLDREGQDITMDDCVAMNRRLRRVLEEADLAADDYAIEVESPGIQRPLITLRHFERFVGQRLRLKLKQPLEGRIGFSGQIASVNAGRVQLETQDGQELEFTPDEVRSARLDPEHKF